MIILTKIKIKANLKNKNENHKYEGKGIKNKNVITYNDQNVITKVIFDNIITVERKKDYFLKIYFKEGINLEGEYITNYGKLKVDVYTKKLNIEKNNLKVIYDLKINNEYIDTFTYNLKYSIDT